MTLTSYFKALREAAPEFIKKRSLVGREKDDFERAIRILNEAAERLETSQPVGNKPIGFAFNRLKEIAAGSEFLIGLEQDSELKAKLLDFLAHDPKSIATPVQRRD